MTKIALDGIVFEQQAVGGISRIYQEILPRLCDLDQSLVVSLLTGGPLAQTLPRHPRITHETLAYWQQHLRPGRYFRTRAVARPFAGAGRLAGQAKGGSISLNELHAAQRVARPGRHHRL